MTAKHTHTPTKNRKNSVSSYGPNKIGVNRQYENFGNYHFGYVAAPSFPLDIALAEAGRAQRKDNKFKWPGKPGRTGLPFTGTPPYGDDPNDQYWIRRGYEDYWKCHRGPMLASFEFWQLYGGIVVSY